MPRANRYFLPGHVWHITTKGRSQFQPFQQFNRFAPFKSLRKRTARKLHLFGMRDRRRYLYWLFEAKRRYGLRVLDYMVTSNHVHLLVKDTGEDVIAQSMQLIAGRTAQEYNERKNRHGRSGRTVTTPRRSKPTHTCIAVWSTSTSTWFAPVQ